MCKPLCLAAAVVFLILRRCMWTINLFIIRSFWSFAQKTIGQLNRISWTNEILRDLSLIWASDGYPTLYCTAALLPCVADWSSAILLRLLNNQVPVYHEERFEESVPSNAWEMIETENLSLNGSLHKYSLCGLHVHFDFFPALSVVYVQLLPWLTVNFS